MSSAYASDSDNESLIHQDSDDEEGEQREHDDDIDLGFRHRDRRNIFSRKRNKDEATYGVFLEDSSTSSHKRHKSSNNNFNISSASTMNMAPIFVSEKRKASITEKNNNGDGDDYDESESISNKAGSTKTTNNNNPFVKSIINEEKLSSHQETASENTETIEEKELREKQQAADEHFLSLLNRGRGKEKLPNKLEAEENKSSSSFSGLGLPKSFGTAQDPPKPAAPKVTKIDPNLGKWEKHTKGIGMKLLAKMGYKGSGGLGSNRRRKLKPSDDADSTSTKVPGSAANTKNEDTNEETEVVKGITKPVEVVVRPANLGLGYGNFKEASQLKVNRQIEAEVRGIKLPEEKTNHSKSKKDNVDFFMQKNKSSALPTTQELLERKQWKRGKRKQKKDGSDIKIIPYTELMEQTNSSSEPVIVDLRGTTTSTTTTNLQDENGEIPLAEELLHNITLLLNTYENKVHSSSYFVKSSKSKCKSLQSDIDDLVKEQTEIKSRVEKLTSVLETMETVESYSRNAVEYKQNEGRIQELIQTLGNNFTSDDRNSLKFWEVLVPTILSRVIQYQFYQWDPLGDLSETKIVIESVTTVGEQLLSTSSNSNNDNDDKINEESDALYVLRQTIFRKELLCRIKQVLENRWKPIDDIEIGLSLYEMLLKCASDLAPKKSSNENDNNDEHVLTPQQDENDVNGHNPIMTILQRQILDDTIVPILSEALKIWKPPCTGDVTTNRLDLWLLPWFPYLDHGGILPNLVSEVIRKLKGQLSHLQRNIQNDCQFFQACIDILKPWKSVISKSKMQTLMSTLVIPRFARFLSKQEVNLNSTKQDWTGLLLANELYSHGLVTPLEYLSLLEGELLTRLSLACESWIHEQEQQEDIVQCYLTWKFKFMIGTTTRTTDATFTISNGEQTNMNDTFVMTANEQIRQDPRICTIFYSILKMVVTDDNDSGDSNSNDNNDSTTTNKKHSYIAPVDTNYRNVMEQRVKEKQIDAEEYILRMEGRRDNNNNDAELEARIRLQRRHRRQNKDTILIFRDVVEEFANEKQVLFQPRMGKNATKDGRQVFLFGNIPVYLDNDVVFALDKAEWKPVSLDQLAAML